MATRGDQDQQTVVYTIDNRFRNSKYDMPKYNARRVYNIVTKKQQKYREEMEHLRRLKDDLKRRIPVEVRTTRRVRKIVGDRRDVTRT